MLFYVNAMLAALLLCCTLLFTEPCLRALAQLLHHTRALSSGELLSFRFFGLICAVALIATPVLRYSGGMDQDYALQRVVMLRIAEMLGECGLSSPASSCAYLVRETGIFAAHAGISERAGITGVINGVSYSIAEMAVAAPWGNEETCLFRGLLLVCKDNRGRTLAPADRRRRFMLNHPDLILPEALLDQNWDKAEHLDLPLRAGMNIAGISTHATQMQQAITISFLSGVHAMALQAASLPAGYNGWDSVFLYKAGKVAQQIKDRFSAGSGRPALAAEIAYESRFSAAPDMVTTCQAPSSPLSENGAFATGMIGDTSIFALPCSASFFGPSSLFRPSFSEANALVLFNLIEWVSGLEASH